MDKELRYLLEQGPTTAQELCRLTGRSKSTIYKQLADDEVIKSDDKPTKYSLKPAETTQDVAGANAEASEVSTPTESPAVAPVVSKGRGRPATATGKRLYLGNKMQTIDGPGASFTWVNPRRPNSHGYRSLQIIIDNPGITTEDYVARGGRLNDLRWDLDKGNVRAE